MNRKTTFLHRALRFAALVMAVGVVACTPDEEETPTIDLGIELELKDASNNTIMVGVTPKNAEKCYIDYTIKGEKSLTAEDVIANGTSANAKMPSVFTIQNAEEGATYEVMAVVTAGNQQESTIIEVSTSNPTEGALELNMLKSAVYVSGDASGNGNYQLIISNTSELGWEGDAEMQLSLFNTADSDPLNAVLPNGVYEAAADKSPFTYVPDYTFISIVRDGELFQSPVMGTITVEREGPTYTILIEGMLLVDQTNIKVSHTGPIQFVESVTATWTKFDQPQEITFESSVGRYLGGWFYPFADDLWIELRSGEMDDQGQMVKGYYMQLSNIYIPKLADYNSQNIELPNGTYNIVNDHPLYTTSYAQPFTFDYGYEMDFYGTMLDVGAYVTYVDQENNINQKGYITCGSFTVSGSGNNYTIDFDLITEEGVSITGTYNGAIDLENYNDSDLDQLWNSRPWTTLTEDHVYDFKPDTEAYAFLEGDYIVEGLDTWLVMIMASNATYPDGYGDFFTTELLVPVSESAEFPTGTFDITWELGANVMIPGYMTYAGGVCFTHYGDLTPDAEGYSTAQAAIADGTVTITKEGDEYKFVFDMEDGYGKKITGEWQGAVIVDDLRDDYVQEDDDHGHDHNHAPSQNYAPMRALGTRR